MALTLYPLSQGWERGELTAVGYWLPGTETRGSLRDHKGTKTAKRGGWRGGLPHGREERGGNGERPGLASVSSWVAGSRRSLVRVPSSKMERIRRVPPARCLLNHRQRRLRPARWRSLPHHQRRARKRSRRLTRRLPP